MGSTSPIARVITSLIFMARSKARAGYICIRLPPFLANASLSRLRLLQDRTLHLLPPPDTSCATDNHAISCVGSKLKCPVFVANEVSGCWLTVAVPVGTVRNPEGFASRGGKTGFCFSTPASVSIRRPLSFFFASLFFLCFRLWLFLRRPPAATHRWSRSGPKRAVHNAS